jgi:hypothetical protein
MTVLDSAPEGAYLLREWQDDLSLSDDEAAYATGLSLRRYRAALGGQCTPAAARRIARATEGDVCEASWGVVFSGAGGG